jgi:hypothetical protein
MTTIGYNYTPELRISAQTAAIQRFNLGVAIYTGWTISYSAKSLFLIID